MGNQASKEAEKQAEKNRDKIARMLPAYGEDMTSDIEQMRKSFQSVMGSLVNQAGAAGQIGMQAGVEPGAGTVGHTAVTLETQRMFEEAAGEEYPAVKTPSGASTLFNPAKTAAAALINRDLAERREGAEVKGEAAEIGEDLLGTEAIRASTAVSGGMRGSAQRAMVDARESLNRELGTQIGQIMSELDLMVTQYEDFDAEARMIRAQRADEAINTVTSIFSQAIGLGARFMPTGGS